MPATITHYLHAETVRDRLAEKGIRTDRSMLLWGAQGPDIMYFHRAMPHQLGKSLRRAGSALHCCDPERLFCTMATLCGGEYGGALDYALGFLCHYSLDRTAHPYIYALQKAYIEKTAFKHNPSYIHNLAESSIDVVMLRELRGKSPFELDINNILDPDAGKISAQSAFLAAALAEILPQHRISQRSLAAAFRDMNRNAALMTDRGGKKKLISALESVLHTGPALSSLLKGSAPDGSMDYMNTARTAWENPFDAAAEPQSSTFYELFDASVDDAVSLIGRFMQRVSGGRDAVTDGRTFSRGIPYAENTEDDNSEKNKKL